MEMVVGGLFHKKTDFPKSVKSEERKKWIVPIGDAWPDCHFKDFLSHLFAIQFNSFLVLEIYLLGFPVPKEFWNTVSCENECATFQRKREGQLAK
jgi:hypothetical protein